MEEARSRLGGAEVSLALIVASRHHAPSAEVVSEAVRVQAGPQRVIGCVAETVVGGEREVEAGPAVAVWLPRCPGPVKEGPLDAPSVKEMDGCQALALSGNRIGVLQGKVVWLKEGPLDTPWVRESDDCQAPALAGGQVGRHRREVPLRFHGNPWVAS